MSALIWLPGQFKTGNCLSNLLCVFLLVIPFWCFAQASITGKVVDKADGKPIPGATVFLNNATGGTTTNKDGFFTLTAIKNGQYDLVVSCIGYETYYQRVIANNGLINLPVIELIFKATELHEVKINPNREEYLKMFIQEFLGNSANARRCKILNPDIIAVNYSNKANTLTAATDDYLEIENEVLGYKVYYKVDKFSKNYSSKLLYYEGPARFEELKGKPSEQKKWLKNREAIYKGSSMHFLRSVFNDNFTEQGFKVLKLTRKPNPNRPPDSVLRAKIRKYTVNTQGHPNWRDSASYYMAKMRLPKTTDYLLTTPLAKADFAAPAEDKQLMQLQYKDNLYVIYLNKAGVYQNRVANNLHNASDNPSTVITLSGEKAIFDSNGIFADPADIVFDGAWGMSGVADLLPVDYMP